VLRLWRQGSDIGCSGGVSSANRQTCKQSTYLDDSLSARRFDAGIRPVITFRERACRTSGRASLRVACEFDSARFSQIYWNIVC
jgi:hypothetical protein